MNQDNNQTAKKLMDIKTEQLMLKIEVANLKIDHEIIYKRK